jgi:ABC-type transporter Mla maintaining outer membrane lipid asymmetry ATPase subunit MlaF
MLMQMNSPLPAEPPMLSTQGVCYSYGMVQALRDVTLSMPQGRVTCIMGRNGVGKTTLLKTLMGLLKPTAGHGGQPAGEGGHCAGAAGTADFSEADG